MVLSPAQRQVLEELTEEYRNPEGCRSALLYGITGSGKTSVFLKLIQRVRDEGKGVIVMVPEISLTSQTIRQFRRWFGDGIALFHSGLSLGERLDEWKRVRRGEASIVVGTRSAVFAPVNHLGLVVIDEEQEHTYQSESSPRYDAREVARYRCWKQGGVLPAFLRHSLCGNHTDGSGEKVWLSPAQRPFWPGGVAPGGTGGHEPGRPFWGCLLWKDAGPRLEGKLPRGQAVTRYLRVIAGGITPLPLARPAMKWSAALTAAFP